jgi:pilus assembly protein CpaF
MEEASLTDLLVNGPDEVWVDRGAGLERTAISMEPAQLESLVGRLADRCGIRVDMSRPVADGSLPDGARLHVVLPPVARRGPLVSIRRFPRRAFSLDDLVERSMMSVELAAELRDAVVGRASILVSGATGTGKTTLMGALLGLVPETERVVLIEETPELPSSAPHAVALVTRQPNVEGRGEVTMADLVRAALRMRPDRIVIGEVRGPEASAALGALSTGHEGSMMTLHARSAAHALQRFVSLALEADGAAPQGSLEARAMDSIDAVVHLSRDGLRRVVEEISWLH